MCIETFGYIRYGPKIMRKKYYDYEDYAAHSSYFIYKSLLSTYPYIISKIF
jgi:hypothetical protein